MKTIVLLLAIAIFYGACEKVEKIEDFPLVPPKLVVNATITAGETMSFEVSKSLSVIDNAEIRIIDNALILLYENNRLIETLDKTNLLDQKYVSVTMAKNDVIYKIEVSAPKFSKVTAAATLPSQVTMSDVEIRFIDTSRYNDYSDTNFKYIDVQKANCSFVIDDPGVEKNYYALLPILTFGAIGQGTMYIINAPLNSEMINNTLFINDETFNGRSQKISFEWGANSILVTPFSKNQFELQLYSLTKEYYDYLISYNYFIQNMDNPFADPVQVYTNVKGGYGIFAGYSLNKKSIPFK
jgi:hypothetical protein